MEISDCRSLIFDPPVETLWNLCPVEKLFGMWMAGLCQFYWRTCSSFFGFFAKATGRTVSQIWTNEGSKRVVPLKGVPFVGLNDVPLNLGVKSPKNWNFGGVNRTFKPEREKNSNPYNLKSTYPIITKFSQEVRTMNEASWVIPWLTQTNPRWRRPPSLILEKCQ